jgi:D-glycero-alpha-D-manno-heptose-7-phosphate kinase
LNKLCGRRYATEKIREIAQNVEAQVIRVPTGSQDYYPALYGGVSAIFVLAYTGAPRNSGINNWEVMKGHIDGDRRIQRNFDRIASIANAMRDAVARNNWDEAGRLMREEWTSRRRNAPGISTPAIDHLVTAARRAGSTGAKACGAGGGGCVVFLVEPGAKAGVARIIERAGARVLPAKVAPRGVLVR